MASGIRVLEEVQGTMRPAPHFRRINLPVNRSREQYDVERRRLFSLDVMIASRKAHAASVGFHASLYDRPSI
jgi:hypothetical protein